MNVSKCDRCGSEMPYAEVTRLRALAMHNEVHGKKMFVVFANPTTAKQPLVNDLVDIPDLCEPCRLAFAAWWGVPPESQSATLLKVEVKPLTT